MATKRAASLPIDPLYDDLDYTQVTGRYRHPEFPDDGPYFPFAAQRLSVTPPPTEIASRIYRSKLRINSPLLSPTAQMLAAVCLTDIYTLDGALSLTGFNYGIAKIGDASKKWTRSDVKFLTTLNHSFHFCSLDGQYEADKGVLMEVRLLWANGRRAVVAFEMRRGSDGALIATGHQEGYYVFIAKL